MQIQLSEKFTAQLLTLPETGMGYQLVKVILKSGKILRSHRVLNGSFLILKEGEKLSEKDISRIEPEG